MQKFSLSFLLPIVGAAGFIIGSELSLLRPKEFILWSLATMSWILIVFAILGLRRLTKHQLKVAIPAVMMIAVAMVTSLLFLDLVSPRRGFILFFAAVLYLFFEHVRHEATRPDAEEKLYIAEYARMVNIGSLFLAAVVCLGVAVFLPFPTWYTIPIFAGVTALWSWHLFYACTEACGRPGTRVLITTMIAAQAYATVLRLPTSIFVGAAVVGVIYYLAASLLPMGQTDSVEPKVVRRLAVGGLLMLLLVILTATWRH